MKNIKKIRDESRLMVHMAGVLYKLISSGVVNEITYTNVTAF